jgi:hypothetical protein
MSEFLSGHQTTQITFVLDKQAESGIRDQEWPRLQVEVA